MNQLHYALNGRLFNSKGLQLGSYMASSSRCVQHCLHARQHRLNLRQCKATNSLQQQQKQQQPAVQQLLQRPQVQQQQQRVRQNRSKPPTNLADIQGSPFHELGLKDITDGMGRVRVRQHVNPLASQFQQPAPIQDWSTVFRDPQLPLFVDMGCGPGRFLLLLCKHHQRQQQHMNYLGLEIRQSLVQRANKWAKELKYDGQVHYHFTNVSISLAGLLKSYPGPIAMLSAQFPDPHFKKRHKKRRMVQQSVVQAARELLTPGGQIFLQSDVFDAITAMRDEFEQHAGDVLELSPLHQTAPVFYWTAADEAAGSKQAPAAAAVAASHAEGVHHSIQPESDSQNSPASGSSGSSDHASCGCSGDSIDSGTDDSDPFPSLWAAGGWLVGNPLDVPTEREHYVLSTGGKVFRVLVVKRAITKN